MKKSISFDAETWASVLDNASSATSKEVTRPELNTAVIDVFEGANGATCAVTTCDGEVEYRENTQLIAWDLEGEKDYSFYVPAELFRTALRGSKGTATLELTDKSFNYRCGRLRVALPYTLDVDIKYLSGQDESSFSPVYIGDHSWFKTAASGASWLIPSRTANEVLKGLYMSVESVDGSPKLTMVASDGIGMIVLSAEHDWIADESPDFILPPKVISVVNSIKTSHKAPSLELLFSPTKHWVLFRIVGDEVIEVRGRIINGKYPDWKKFFQPAVGPDNNSIVVNNSIFTDELIRLNNLAFAQGADFTRFEITFSEDSLAFDALSTASDITDQLSLDEGYVDLSFSEVRSFAVDTGLVSRFLSTVKADSLRISYSTSMSPVSFVALSEEDSAERQKFVVMPCRR